MQHRARAEEEQPFERGMVDGVIQAGHQRQGCQQRMARVQKHQPRAQADEDDADVLDTVISQQPLEVVLHQRVKHPEHRGNGPDDQHRHAPPQRRRAEEVEADTSQPVNAAFDEHP